ncbi:MAG: CBS domain-containing protein [Acidimicrobiia bacterium]|nr:CBS domain-containing protein [Acidimicrobiia bacterium]
MGEVPTSCLPRASLWEAARVMTAAEIGSVVVIDRGALTGILTERDILRAVAVGANLNRNTVRNWMSVDPYTASQDTNVEEAVAWMMATGYRHLPVVDDDRKLIGIVSIKDVLWAVTDAAARQRASFRQNQ